MTEQASIQETGRIARIPVSSEPGPSGFVNNR
jgi:hypothetical protein